MKNRNLHNAKHAKNDEFYTQLTDIEKELSHYRKHFKNKTVLCNCDDPRVSNFFHFFSYNFERLGLKKLITTCYCNDQPDLFSKNDRDEAIYLEYDGAKDGDRIPNPKDIGIKYLKGNGDFRSDECIELLKQADIVVTNPPFSLFREYVAQLMEYEKKFLIIGNPNAVTYKEIFPLVKDGKLWVGNKSMGTDMLFDLPIDFAKELAATKKEGSGYKIIDGVIKGRAFAIWFTNLPHKKRNEELVLTKRYRGNEGNYPKYDNYNAIEVSKVINIPKDYKGVMGVPISFLDKYNPNQFEIVKFRHGDNDKDLSINSKCPYFRILIRHKAN